jgi:deoxyribose-phosphate aldolase
MDTSAQTVKNAQRAVSLMDLTRLNDDDTEQDIRALCARASGPAGSVAAVCVWPRFAALTRSLLPQEINVAAVVNFPHGDTDIEPALAQAREVIAAGAQEIDVVMPYRALQQGNIQDVKALLEAVRAQCPQQVLKVILETGELKSPELIALASDLSIDAGADFLKTSTGKTPVNATADAASIMLRRIAARGDAGAKIGFKASGGIRTLDDALVYMNLQVEYLGQGSLTKARFRLGASSLLDNLEEAIGHGSGTPSTIGY